MNKNDRKERIAAAVIGIQKEDLAAAKNRSFPNGSKRTEELKEKQLQNALASFAAGCRREDIAVFCDTTFLDNGKKGILFSTEGMYYSDINFGRKKNPLPQPVKYAELRGVEIGKNGDHIVLNFQDGAGKNFLEIFIRALSRKHCGGYWP